MSNKIGYKIKQDHSIVLLIEGKLHTVGKDDINFQVVLDGVKNEDWDSVRRAVSVRQAIADHTDGRVEIFGEEIFIDKKKLPEGISRRVLPVLKANSFNLKPLFRLLENIEANPEAFSRNELYLFLDHNDLPITPDGCFLAYKMVRSDYLDIHSGKIDNSVGRIVSMKREAVDKDRHRTCSQGLHFCSYEYLPKAYYTQDKSRRLMVVKIHPADVVSIPSDYNNSKGRCWKYEVVDELAHFEDSLAKGFTHDHGDVLEKEDESDLAETGDITSDEVLDAREATFDYSKKLDENGVREIRKWLADNWSLAWIAARTGISARQIARIRDGQAWTNVK